jgi:hypothetical protein
MRVQNQKIARNSMKDPRVMLKLDVARAFDSMCWALLFELY